MQEDAALVDKIAVQMADLHQNLKINLSQQINISDEHIGSTLVDHKNQIQTILENIAVCITIMNGKIGQRQCSCETTNSMSRL